MHEIDKVLKELKTPEGQEKVDAFIKEYIEKQQIEDEKIKSMLSNTSYVEWLKKFTKNKDDFDDEEWVYCPEQLSEIDSENVRDLYLFYRGIERYARSNNIVPNYFDFGVFVMIGCLTGGTFEKKFDGVMTNILKVLEFLEAPKKDICPSSGVELTEENSTLIGVQIGAFPIQVTLTNDAVTSVNQAIEQVNEDFKQAPNNYLKGYLGIMIGGVAGVVATIVFSAMGFVSALSSFISIFLGIFLYKKFGGKPNWVMIVMSLLTTIVFILGVILYAYVNISVAMLAENGITKAGIDALKYCLENSDEIAKSFRMDMLLNGLFCVIGIAASIMYMKNQVKRPKGLKG